MIGAFLELSTGLESQFVDRALRHLVKNERWLEIDRRAIERGRELARV